RVGGVGLRRAVPVGQAAGEQPLGHLLAATELADEAGVQPRLVDPQARVGEQAVPVERMWKAPQARAASPSSTRAARQSTSRAVSAPYAVARPGTDAMSGSSYWPMSAVYVHGTAPFSRIHATATEVSRPPEKAMPTRSPTGREQSTLDMVASICIALHEHAMQGQGGRARGGGVPGRPAGAFG